MPHNAPQQRKKVLFLITKSNFGGAQRYVLELATHLLRTHEVTVGYGGTGAAHSSAGELARRLQERGVRTVLLPSLGRDVGIADLAAYKEIASLVRVEKPDIVHLNSSKAAGLGALAARLLRVPRIIFTAHGWPFWEQRGAFSTFARRAFSYLTVFLAHETICISSYDAAALPSVLRAMRSVHVIRNAASATSFLSRSVAREKLLGTTTTAHEKDIWVTVIAEHTKNKNLARALDVAHLYNQTHPQKMFLVLIGDGEERHALETYAGALAVSAQVHFCGFVPNAPEYLKAFDVLLLTSEKEGVPYVLLEAQAAGVPWVAPRIGGIPEIASWPGAHVVSHHLQEITSAVEMAHTSKPEPVPPDTERFVRETLQVY